MFTSVAQSKPVRVGRKRCRTGAVSREALRRVLLLGCVLLFTSACSEDPASAANVAPEHVAQAPKAGELVAEQVSLDAAPPVQTPTTLLVLGDSISAAYGIQREQGWVALLEAQVKRSGSEHRVVNASLSGETTGGALARLPAALTTHQPDLVIIELGGNDGLRGYPVRRIRDNLAKIIDTAQAAGASVLLVGMQIPPNYGPRYSQAFAGLFSELAGEYEIPMVASFLDDVALAGNLMQADGIHPTAAAQPRLLASLWPSVVNYLRTRD